MSWQAKTNQELIEEISLLNNKIKELKQSESERKRMEEVLQESEERFHRLLQSVPEIAIQGYRLDGTTTYWNQASERLYGYTAQEAIGQNLLALIIPPEMRREVQMSLQMMIETGEPIPSAEVSLMRKDGVRVTVFSNHALVKLPGSPIELFCLDIDLSYRRQAEEALRESEEKYRGIFDQSITAVYIFDDKKNFINTNQAGLDLLGSSREELLYMSIPDVDADPAVVLPAHQELLSGGRLINYEHRLRRKDGTIITVLNNSMSIKDVHGSVVGMLSTLIDITSRRQAEDTLRQTRQNYETFFNTIDEFLFVLDEQGNIIHTNTTVTDRLGYTTEELWGQSVLMIHPPERRDEAGKIVGEMLNGSAEFCPVPIITKSGIKIPVETRVSHGFWDGKPVIFGVTKDISEARLSEEKFSKLFHLNPSACGLSDLDNRKYIEVNEAFYTLLGFDKNEVIGKTPSELGIATTETINAILRKADSNGNVTNAEADLKAKNGDIKQVLLSSENIYVQDKKYRLTVVHDITERKQTEAETRILEERLKHTDKMEAIGTLAGGIAHDFNNLLMGIQGHASLVLLDLDPSHPHYDRLKSIEEQVQSGADLTRQLLGFARGGRYEVKPADMNDIIKETSSMFGRTKKEISIHRKYGKDLPTAEVDRGQMTQVFMNLYVNAWQAMLGGGEIYLETEDVLLDDEQAVSYAITPGRYVKITVTDTGTGMDETTRERIFDPFFTTKEMGRGTGLGLATVYGIIKGHKGMINVYSEPGHGTTFNIYLPASEKEVVKVKTATRTIARGTETILLVDDEKMVREASKAMLESMGYRVYATGSGQDAIAVYMEKKNEINLVILDMIMPGISGGETFDRLREINPGIKVLLSSGYSIEGQAQEIMDRGCNGFLQKPFRLERLSRKVREMID